MSAIPDFIDNYHLPNDEHLCTFQDIEEKFVSNETRKQKWQLFMNLYDRLCSLGLQPKSVLIDGSFVTGREEPGDVDFAALITPESVRNALRNITDDHDRVGIQMFTQPQNAEAIRNLFGAHLLVCDNEQTLKKWSKFFRRGQHGKLREPDPDKDPSWVKRPSAKGILRVDI